MGLSRHPDATATDPPTATAKATCTTRATPSPAITATCAAAAAAAVPCDRLHRLWPTTVSLAVCQRHVARA